MALAGAPAEGHFVRVGGRRAGDSSIPWSQVRVLVGPPSPRAIPRELFASAGDAPRPVRCGCWRSGSVDLPHALPRAPLGAPARTSRRIPLPARVGCGGACWVRRTDQPRADLLGGKPDGIEAGLLGGVLLIRMQQGAARPPVIARTVEVAREQHDQVAQPTVRAARDSPKRILAFVSLPRCRSAAMTSR